METSAKMGWGRAAISHPSAQRGEGGILSVGARRSYGDVCLLSHGTTHSSVAQDCLLDWDEKNQAITVSAGLRIGQLCAWANARGFFPPVVPGTQYATIGGCVANDVHGKNHCSVGSFGCHVTNLTLRRYGETILCSPSDNSELFYATLGGLGLTGEICTVTVRLIPMPSSYFNVRRLRFHSLDEWLEIDRTIGKISPYSVAWVDCSLDFFGAGRLRGLYSVAEPCPSNKVSKPQPLPRAWLYPLQHNFSWINRTSVKAFNALYWAWPRSSLPTTQHYRSFLFPLDGLMRWNALHGARGFFQHQCVLPLNQARDGLYAMLRLIRRSGEGSPMVVLKRLGARSSGGWLSFPREGYTLAVDINHRGESSLRLMRALESLTADFGGVLYPAKDALMSAENFVKFYPRWIDLEKVRERGRISDFWLRVTGINPDH